MLACEVWDVAPSCWKYPIESSSLSSWFTATSHTSHANMTEIQSFFGDRVMPKEIWPPCSPDLTPPDYFLWGYLKGTVYQKKPQTIDALKANITEEIQAVTADVLARTFQNVARRVQSCLDVNGRHFQHMLWCRHIFHTTNVLLFKFRCNIFIGFRVIKEMPGLVGSATPCRLPRLMKHYSPTGRNNHGRPLKRLLDTWDRNGSTSGPTLWQIYAYGGGN